MGLRPSESRRLEALEADYRAILTHALRACAAGEWGLLGANDDTVGAERWRPQVVDELIALGQDIDALRHRDGLPRHELHRRFVEERARRGGNMPGEPKRATAWLTELAQV
jgi:hypothetical protein